MPLPVKSTRLIAAILFIISLLSGSLVHEVQAQATPTLVPSATQEQSSDQGWNQPVNLSRSGAASQPRIIASPDGRLQAFWIDRFDGLMTSIYNGTAWSLPVQASFPPRRGGQKPINISTIPYIIADSKGLIHAFWYGEKDSKTGESPLNYNQMPIGSISWSISQQVAESALVFDVSVTETNELVLGYIRTLKTDEIPPGVYYRSTTNQTQAWKPGSAVSTSIYFRILPPEEATIRVATTQGTAFLVWSEPHLGEMLYSESLDGGTTWNSPTPLGTPEDQPTAPRLAIPPQGEILRSWQASSQSGCVLYQQQLTIQNQSTPSSQQTPTPAIPAGRNAPTPAAEVALGEWTQPMRILEGMDFCPQSDRFWLLGGSLFWIWGEGSTRLFLSAQDPSSRNWSIPQPLSFSFEDPDSQLPVQLDDIHTTMFADKLALIGKDPSSNEVWVTTSQISTLELAFAPPSPWLPPLRISSEEQTASDPTIAIDSKGRVHMVWAQGIGYTSNSLFYARYDGKTASPPSEIVRSASGEFLRQPALLADAQDRLHLIWSGGEADQVFYSRAQADQAGSASGWLPALTLSEAINISWPQIIMDSAGQLIVLYAVPVNEQRGIYLIRSNDGGDRWTEPETVFDAATAGWNVIDRPSLVTAPDGIVHVAWVKTQVPGSGVTLGIFYTRSKLPLYTLPAKFSETEETGVGSAASPDQMAEASNWIEPWELAPANSNWPRLAILRGNLHLLYANVEGLNHRWLNLAQQTPDGGGWGSLSRVPGWQSLTEQGSVSSDRAPFAWAVDGQSLHLVSTIPGGVDLQYSTWIAETDSTAGNRWSQPEVFNPLGNWVNTAGGIVAVPPTGGSMAIAWQALPPAIEGTIEVLPKVIYFTSRVVPTREAIPSLPPLPTATSTPEPSPSPTEVPTPTPPLSLEPPPSESPIPPLALGGGLAAIIVIAIFAGILLRGKHP